jgi:Cu/Ag efflux pump CusA
MSQVEIRVWGDLLAASAELEAMKIANAVTVHKLNEPFVPKYSEQDFLNKAHEINSITNQLYK